jgi:DnaA-homolog protein
VALGALRAYGRPGATDALMKQIPLAIGPEPLMTFDSFVAGSNEAALVHLRALAVEAGAPVYLWGASGCGKTHLLRALAEAVRLRGGSAGWFGRHAPLPWLFDPGWSLVVLDDCDGFDNVHQHAAFALFIDAAAHGAQIAAAGALPPTDLPLRDDLRSRLGWGDVFALDALAEAPARVVLFSEAARRGIQLSDEVLGFLMTRFSRDLKHLMQLLDRLDQFALAERRAVTVPLLKKMFEEEG